MSQLFSEHARRPLKHFNRWLAVGWILIGIIIILSLIPDYDLRLVQEFVPNDKVGHFLAYGTLMGWFVQLYYPLRTKVVLCILFICMGVGLEVLQSLTLTRTYDIYDMLANSIGVILGLLLSHGAMGRLLIRFENRLQRAQ